MKETKTFLGIDAWLERLKRLERRYYLADYEDEHLRQKWLEKPGAAPFEERVVSVMPDGQKLSSVLIFKPDDIGDAVQSLPAIQELKRAFPNIRLYLLCQQKTKTLFERTKLFEEIQGMEVRIRAKRFPHLDLKKALNGFSLTNFDATIFLRTYPAFFNYFLQLPSPIKIHPLDPRLASDSIFRVPVSQWGETRYHQALQLLEIVGVLTRRSYTYASLNYPTFHWSESDKDSLSIVFPDGAPKRFIVVHPFNRLETKRYPMDYWTAILKRLAQRFDVPLVIVGGGEDSLFPEGLAVRQTQGKLDLMQTGYLISQAAAFIGNESGPAHLASALGIPTVTLMGGHSIPVEWAPLGKSLVLRADVPCAPCHLRACPVYGLACLNELRPERILPDVESFIVRHAFGESEIV